MSETRIAHLDDCSQFRQTLLARPPAVIHATLMLSLALLTGGVIWASCTKADLVVRAQGRVRPMTRKHRLASAASEESRVAPLRDGRVSALYVREGQRVRQGDLLLLLDDRELANDIARQERTIDSLQTELEKSKEMERLVSLRYQTARAKANAEILQAEQNVASATQRRDTESRLAAVRVAQADDAYRRVVRLQARNAVSAEEVAKSDARLRETRLEMEKAQAPVEQGTLPVLIRALELVEREWTVEINELKTRQSLKQSEYDAAKIELASLKLRREQTRLLAPSDGVITSIEARVGDVIDAGKTALKLVDQAGFRLDLAVANDDVGDLRVGMPVRVKLDAYDFQRFGTVEGTVIFIAPDTEAADAASNDDVTKKTASRYLVKVALRGQDVGRGAHWGQIKLGMTAQAEIVTGTEALLSLLFRSLRRSISLG